MPILHTAIQSADCHEPKHITSAVIADAGKVITPSSGTNGVSVLRKLTPADIEGYEVPVDESTAQTLTNKRITPRVSNVLYAASIGVNSDSFDVLACDSVEAALTVNAPSGTPTDGQRLTIRLTQDAIGGWAITYNAAFVLAGSGPRGPNETETRVFIWHAAAGKWVQEGLRALPRVNTQAYAANLTVDAGLYDVLACDSLTGNVTINAPSGSPVDGQELVVRLTQDATGGRTITYDVAFVTTGASTTTLSTTETRSFRWHAARAKWVQTSLTTGL